MSTQTYDVAVVGGGPAGLTAALVLGRARRRVAVVDAGAPRNAPAAHMQGFLSRDGMFPARRAARRRASGSPPLRRRTRRRRGDGRRAGLHAPTRGRRHARSAASAPRDGRGRRAARHPRRPGVLGAFLHCPYCHGWEVRDQPIGVLGTGPGSAEYAQLLRQWSDDGVFFAHTSPLGAAERAALDAREIRVVDGLVTRLSVVDDRLDAVELADGRAVPRAAVFIRPALRAHRDGLVESLGCEVDGAGLVRVDAAGRTSVPGVWAAGNAANPRAQVITAAGEGSAAAIAMNADLVEEDVRQALQRVSAT